MTRRLEVGPLLVALGAVLLLVSLFLDWFHGGLTAWNVFEVWDLVLAVLGVAALLVALGLIAREIALLEAGALPYIVGAVVVIVASQIINPPPAAGGEERDVGCWIALGAAALQLLGVVLTLSRVSFAINVEGRDTRRRVAAVDAREPTTTESGSLFSRPPEPAAPTKPSPPEPAAARPAGARASEPAASPEAPVADESEEAPPSPRRRSTSTSRRKT